MMIHIGSSPMGHNIRSLRRKRGLSRGNLARMTGIPYLTLLRIETGILREIRKVFQFPAARPGGRALRGVS